MTLTPAYGQVYESQEHVLSHFNQDKDFILTHLGKTTYINKPQIPSGTKIQFKFNNLKSTFIHTLP